MADAPTQLLERAVQQRVELRLKDGRALSGRLLGCDEHMNIVLDEAEERSNEVARRLGRLVLRGSNVVSLNIPTGGRASS
ncbi:MAG TPA: LSM domain-containing protein [Thermoplasmata archaeon]|nr:LSM domain-containing protein [Thermoplasmata archaeon]